MRRPGTPDGVYVMAAALFDDADIESARQSVAELTFGRHQRFHWRTAGARERKRAVEVVGALPALHVVVVGGPLRRGFRQERARRLVLARLLYELDAAGVVHVLLDARTRVLNDRDLAAVVAWRRQHVIGSTILVGHAYPEDEPLPWVPDIIAGVLNGDEPTYQTALVPLMALTEIKFG